LTKNLRRRSAEWEAILNLMKRWSERHVLQSELSMRHGRGISGDLVGGDVEQREHIRIDHGARSLSLGVWLQDRCREGFDLPEAEHLCRRIYYKFDGIPMALRAQLCRDTLAALFTELVRLGWIRTAGGIEQVARDPQHWRNLLTPDYSRIGPVYDVVLGEAAFGRLLPHPGQA
jgi:hypothetical protein